jgi:hypothetical protein
MGFAICSGSTKAEIEIVLDKLALKEADFITNNYEAIIKCSKNNS